MVAGRARLASTSVGLAGGGRRATSPARCYPDQSLYPANSVPAVVRRINNALLRADQIDRSEGTARSRTGSAPIVADAEAGFGGAAERVRADEGA